VKHAEQRGIRVPTQHLLWDQGKPLKTLICGDYEECLMGYRNPVRTSPETQYVSATEPRRLMRCKS
jgi:hypothetical protein